MIYPASWTCTYTDQIAVTLGTTQTQIVDRPCVVKSITFTARNTTNINDPITVNVLDGDTEIFTLFKEGLPNYSHTVFAIKFPLAGVRFDNSFEIKLDGGATRSLKGITTLYQAGSTDSIVVPDRA